ncbi:FAD-dependent monooxygenase [Catenulispora pinisilvae]|uniref:FAD-dependent monooxygenase n=1 Tax=Catenulispora pinisilvae TaxID=2705253 RepID=UPI0018913F08|nr:FAD-dependent monooxygenase [Catenulispora pinisilvae]
MRIVIVGGGPVGLMAACELRLYGIEAVVLERRPEIDPTIKAGAIQGRGVDALDRRGLADRVREAGGERLLAFQNLMREHGIRGHFSGMFVLREGSYGGETVLPVAQQALEEVLNERAAELGVDVRRGHRVLAWDQDSDGVTLRVAGSEPGPQAQAGAEAESYELRADWLIGADGGRSLVRKGGAFTFPGTDGIITGYQAIAELDDPDFVPLGWNRREHGMVVNGPNPGRLLLVGFDGPPADRDAPVTPEELQTALRRISGTQVSVKAITTVTRFTDNARQADTYRDGRVLLAGDAAHVHSPFGGQGLNLGLGDAMNLGWKLALVARGQAPDSLLDTYTAERHPVAARVLDNTRAQVALMRPGPHADALRGIFAKLLAHDDANRWLTDMMGGDDLRYDVGSDLDAVGRFCPDLRLDTLDGPVRLAERLRSGRGQLFVTAQETPDVALWIKTAAEWGDRVEVTVGTGTGGGTSAEAPSRAVLVRPDGFIAWTAESEQPLTEVLGRWFGPAEGE